MNSLRILSLLPAATEMVYLLGLKKYLVGVSHECDYPSGAKLKPKVTSSIVDNTMSSQMIDDRVKKTLHRGRGALHIKEDILEKLSPNLILTQELCEVCAIGFSEVKKAARMLDGDLKIISLEPESVEDILENILLVGEATEKILEARLLVDSLKKRLKKLESSTYYLVSKRPKVLVIEWLDPIMVAGHWVPEMVERAGGKNLISNRGSRSKIVTIDQIIASRPDILVISPCGFDIERTRKEMSLVNKIVKAVKPGKWRLIDGNAYMTRPGPRVIDGIEKLSDVILSS